MSPTPAFEPVTSAEPSKLASRESQFTPDINRCMKWIKAWLRTRKALNNLQREIDVERIKLGIDDIRTIKEITQKSRLLITGLESSQAEVDRKRLAGDRLVRLCKTYLIVKRVGSDAAVVYRMGLDDK